MQRRFWRKNALWLCAPSVMQLVTSLHVGLGAGLVANLYPSRTCTTKNQSASAWRAHISSSVREAFFPPIRDNALSWPRPLADPWALDKRKLPTPTLTRPYPYPVRSRRIAASGKLRPCQGRFLNWTGGLLFVRMVGWLGRADLRLIGKNSFLRRL